MNAIKLYDYQQGILDDTKDFNRVAYYLDMGLGKTFVGSEKMQQLRSPVNLVVCQKSKLSDWVEHFEMFYGHRVYDLTKKLDEFVDYQGIKVGVINYDLIYLRPRLFELEDFSLMLDESSIIQNSSTQRWKAINKLKFKNVILLSGTPTSGKYENLWTQCKLLGYDIPEKIYNAQYIEYKQIDVEGLPMNVVSGYKNVNRLKRKLRQHGAVFMKTEEAIDLPEQIFITEFCKNTKEYREFEKHDIIEIDGKVLVGSRLLPSRIYKRMLAGYLNENKIAKFKDIINSTDDRIIVFYNFNDELEVLKKCTDKPISIINGNIKDLSAYHEYSNSITFLQYQAGARGHNLQLANTMIFFSPTESSELFEQGQKRIHRVGQSKKCKYYLLKTINSIEFEIYDNLKNRKEYTDELFEEEKMDMETISN